MGEAWLAKSKAIKYLHEYQTPLTLSASCQKSFYQIFIKSFAFAGDFFCEGA
jgi:hypothetical protein